MYFDGIPIRVSFHIGDPDDGKVTIQSARDISICLSGSIAPTILRL